MARQANGTYVVSTYREIAALLHDPRISSDERKNRRRAVRWPRRARRTRRRPTRFIFLDPPEHDRLRRLVMGQFGPPDRPGDRRHAPMLSTLVDELLDALRGEDQVDLVDDFAYPLPVTVICDLLGVPREDEPRFHAWADAAGPSASTRDRLTPGGRAAGRPSPDGAGEYLAGLIDERRAPPEDDLLSGLATGDGPAGRMDERRSPRPPPRCCWSPATRPPST